MITFSRHLDNLLAKVRAENELVRLAASDHGLRSWAETRQWSDAAIKLHDEAEKK